MVLAALALVVLMTKAAGITIVAGFGGKQSKKTRSTAMIPEVKVLLEKDSSWLHDS